LQRLGADPVKDVHAAPLGQHKTGLAQPGQESISMTPSVLFVCVHNAGRPASQPVEVVRRIRDDIAERARALIDELAPR